MYHFTNLRLAVVEPRGHISASEAIAFREQLVAAVSSSRHATIVVDMGRVESLDSDGLMALVSALALAQAEGRSLTLCCVPPSIQIIFELTRLDQVFEIHSDRPFFEAIAA